MAYTRAQIVLFIFALLAIPMAFLELAFGHKFSSLLWKKRWTENIHVLWCAFANSRFAWIFGAAVFVLSPVWFLVVTIFSLVLLLAQIVLDWKNTDRVKFGKFVENRLEAARAIKEQKRRGSYFGKPAFMVPGVGIVDRLLAENDSEARDIVYDLPEYKVPPAPNTGAVNTNPSE